MQKLVIIAKTSAPGIYTIFFQKKLPAFSQSILRMLHISDGGRTTMVANDIFAQYLPEPIPAGTEAEIVIHKVKCVKQWIPEADLIQCVDLKCPNRRQNAGPVIPKARV